MTDTKLMPGGAAVDDRYMVSADQVTIVGNGTTDDPLRLGGPLVAGVDVEDDGVPIAGNPHTTLNFEGDGVSVADVGGVATVTIPGGAGSVDVSNDGSPLGSFAVLNLVGPSLEASDAGGGVADVVATGAVAVSAVHTSNVVASTAPQVVRVDPTLGGLDVTLPSAASFPGRSVVVKNVSPSTNIVRVLGAGGDTVDGSASQSLSGDHFFVVLVSDGVAEWMVVGG